MCLKLSTYPVVLACDAAYAMPLATVLRSIIETNQSSRPLEFYVLSEGFSESTKEKVFRSLPEETATIKWLEVDLSPFGDFATLPHISKMTYSRLLIPSLFPDTVSKVLYLDADILVLSSLEKLWEIDLGNNIIGAVADRWAQNIKRGDEGFNNVPHVQDYFNAGVLVINLDLWREKKISDKAFDYLLRHPQSPFSDQDALNVVCDGLWKKLDSRWNFQEHIEYVISNIKSEKSPFIVHFVGKSKPWNASLPNKNAQFYDAIRSRTCFARTYSDEIKDLLKGFWFSISSILLKNRFYRSLRGYIKSAIN